MKSALFLSLLFVIIFIYFLTIVTKELTAKQPKQPDKDEHATLPCATSVEPMVKILGNKFVHFPLGPTNNKVDITADATAPLALDGAGPAPGGAGLPLSHTLALAPACSSDCCARPTCVAWQITAELGEAPDGTVATCSLFDTITAEPLVEEGTASFVGGRLPLRRDRAGERDAATLLALRAAEKNEGDFTCSCTQAQQASYLSDQLAQITGALQSCASTKATASHALVTLLNGTGARHVPSHRTSRLSLHPRSAVLAPGELGRLTIEARDEDDVPIDVGGATFFWARIISERFVGKLDELDLDHTPLVAPVDLVDWRNGTYTGTFRVWVEGSYRVQARFDSRELDSSGLEVRVEATSPATRLPSRDSLPVCSRADVARYSDAGYYANGRYHLPHCQLHHWTADEARRCLARRNLMFRGDSLNRVLFWALANLVVDDDHLSHFDGYMCFYNRTVPEEHGGAHLTFACGWNSLFYQYFPRPEHATAGPQYYDGSFFRSVGAWWDRDAEGRDWPNPWASPTTGADPDVLIMSAAAHDMIRDDLAAYEYNLNEQMRLLREEWGFHGDLVWLTSTAPDPAKTGVHFPHYKWMQTVPKCYEYDAVARRVLSDWNATIIDTLHLTLPVPEYTFDGQHYVRSPDTDADPVYVAQRDELLTVLCPTTH
mmetsp:Transcript_15835/g.49523  ORF Transcript_15835/g.49523 Transcript_15835/m.49523 type:complete len:660 (-) Transcript_15835:770-2749(-)